MPVQNTHKIKTIIFILIFYSEMIVCASQGKKQLQVFKNVYKLQQEQILNLTISEPIKINIFQSKRDKPHSLLSRTSNNIPQQLNNNENKQNKILDMRNEIIIIYYLSQGNAQCYYSAKTNQKQAKIQSKQIQHLQKANQFYQTNNEKEYSKKYLQLKEGINRINIQKIIKDIQQQTGNKLIANQSAIVCFPKQPSRIIIKLGSLQYTIVPLIVTQSIIIQSKKDELQHKIFNLQINSSYAVRFERNKGFPIIKIFECPKQNKNCFQVINNIPNKQYDNNLKQQKQKHAKFVIEGMLSKTQEYIGTKCTDCEVYLQISAKQQKQVEVQVTLQPSSTIMLLQQNQILKQDLSAGTTKKYEINLNKKQQVRVSIQVYEGEVKIKIKQRQGKWQNSPPQKSGVILINIPTAIDTQTLDLQVQALGKDATYSVVYSEGQYQIFIKDGYPTSHVLNPKQNISFFYHNQQLNEASIYVSFNVNVSKSVSSLDMKIYCYQFLTKSKQTKTQFKTNSTIKEISKQASSGVIQIPGSYPKIQIYFYNSWVEAVEIAMTINDQQIVFLPLYHSLPLQIDKDDGVNLLVDNNEQGFIELTIKKCDQSLPQIAYSLSPQDFMRKIYDYESLGDSQRITKSTIKVKKGGGLYIHISGDKLSNSFIEISAKYMQKDRKKLGQGLTIKRGNRGQIDYQLLTNAKAEIWFTQVECSLQCKQNTKYYVYHSTSRSDLYRQMICPKVFMLKNQQTQKPQTDLHQVKSKVGNDKIIAFKENIVDPIIFLSVKAVNNEQQLVYKDIQIITFVGQMRKMPKQFLFILIGIIIVIAVLFIAVLSRQSKAGYTAIRSTQQKLKKLEKSKSLND